MHPSFACSFTGIFRIDGTRERSRTSRHGGRSRHGLRRSSRSRGWCGLDCSRSRRGCFRRHRRRSGRVRHCGGCSAWASGIATLGFSEVVPLLAAQRACLLGSLVLSRTLLGGESSSRPDCNDGQHSYRGSKEHASHRRRSGQRHCSRHGRISRHFIKSKSGQVRLTPKGCWIDHIAVTECRLPKPVTYREPIAKIRSRYAEVENGFHHPEDKENRHGRSRAG